MYTRHDIMEDSDTSPTMKGPSSISLFSTTYTMQWRSSHAKSSGLYTFAYHSDVSPVGASPKCGAVLRHLTKHISSDIKEYEDMLLLETTAQFPLIETRWFSFAVMTDLAFRTPYGQKCLRFTANHETSFRIYHPELTCLFLCTATSLAKPVI